MALCPEVIFLIVFYYCWIMIDSLHLQCSSVALYLFGITKIGYILVI